LRLYVAESNRVKGLVRFSEPIALTSVFPYLPEMIQSFPGVLPADVGFWTGISSAVFAIAQCVTAIPWGSASDRYGRKWIILLGLFNTMLASVLWGLSTNLWFALTVRTLAGAMNGNVGVMRTVVAEHCPYKELQPRAFSLMPLVYNIGSIVGPMMGGWLANPLGRPAGDHSPGPFLWRFPYALPNLVAAGVFIVGIVVGLFFMEETHETLKFKRDPFLRMGDRIQSWILPPALRFWAWIRRKEYIPISVDGSVVDEMEYSAVPASPEQFESGSVNDELGAVDKEGTVGLVAPPIKLSEVLNRDTILFLMSYTSMAMHNTAFDQIIAVFMHQQRTGPDIFPDSGWLRFNKGFGLGKLSLLQT
jgi:MFS family permease